MAKTCDAQQNSLNRLIDNKVITDYRKILNRQKFDEYNEKYTAFAKSQYGLDTKGELLYSVEQVKQTDPRAPYYRESTYNIFFANPNLELFAELNDIINDNNLPLPEEQEGVNFLRVDMGEYFEEIPLVELDLDKVNNSYAQDVADSLMRKLSKNLNVPYSIINSDEAAYVLRNADIQYNGEPAFLLCGKSILCGRKCIY